MQNPKQNPQQKWTRALFAIALVPMLLCLPVPAYSAQSTAAKAPSPSPGDQPEDPGPLATDLSSALRSHAIHAAMRRVARWQLQRVQAQPPSRDWDFGTLDVGFMAASQTLHDPRYSRYVASVGEHFQWELTPLRPFAPGNDYAIAQAFLALYNLSHPGAQRDAMIAPLRKRLDDSLQTPDDPARPVWWWCDALFMEPGAGVELSRITGDTRYAQYVQREWSVTENLLYDPQKHLFSRDASYLNKHEKNGEKIFWSRGNGWVMGGLVRILQSLPPDDPARAHYVELLRAMAAAVAATQGSDGLWRAGLLDAPSYPLPEISGSAFFTYAIAWGINHNLLDTAQYRPVVAKAWSGMLAHIYRDGRLGSIQPIGEAPDGYREDSSYVFGVGAFLLAGSEVDILSRHGH